MDKRRITCIKAQLDVIAAMTYDKDAHQAEDNLWEMVLNWIALGDDDAANLAELASLALDTKKIEFARWCA